MMDIDGTIQKNMSSGQYDIAMSKVNKIVDILDSIQITIFPIYKSTILEDGFQIACSRKKKKDDIPLQYLYKLHDWNMKTFGEMFQRTKDSKKILEIFQKNKF